MKGAVRWFVENHVAANLLVAFFIFAGITTALTMKVEVFPPSVPDKISITVEYPGASPSEIEESIIKPIEEKVSGVSGIDKIYSVAKEGYGTITLDVMKGWDVKKVVDDVKTQVDTVTNLPEDAEKPVVREVVIKYPVVSIAVYGDVDDIVLKKTAEMLRDEIASLPQITEANVYAVRPEEIHVEIPQKNLVEYRTSINDISSLIRSYNFDLPAGRIKTPQRETLIRTKQKKKKASEYWYIPIKSDPYGALIYLSDLATITEGFRDDIDVYGYFNGEKTAIVQVYRVGNQNAITVAQAVKKYLKTIDGRLPEGVHVKIFQDTTTILKSRLFLLLKNMAIGMTFVIFILGLFLNPRLSFWITLGIPVSFAAALAFLPHVGVSINMISLFAFILVLGIVVDDAIVIGENVFKKREEGLAPVDAAVQGTLEVGIPVIFSVLTTVAAFVPLLFGSGVIGKIISHIPKVVILVLMGSLLEALFILPSHLSRSKALKAKVSKETWASRKLKNIVDKYYEGSMKFLLDWRYATVCAFIAILIAALGITIGGRLKFTFFPPVESDWMVCRITMPAGTPVEKTEKVILFIRQKAMEVLEEFEKKLPPGSPPLFRYSLTMVGTQIKTHGPQAGIPHVGSHLAQVTIGLLKSEYRTVSVKSIVSEWRKKIGLIPDAESIQFMGELFSAGEAIQFALSHRNEKVLLKAVDDLKKRLSEFAGVYDIRDSFLPGKDEIQIKLKPFIKNMGISPSYIALAIRNAFYGAEALRFQRDKDEVRVLVRFPENERKYIYSLKNMWITLPDGREVPLSEIADFKTGREYLTLERLDGHRVIYVTASVDETVANAAQIRATLMNKIMPELERKYPGLRYSLEGEGKEHAESMRDVKDAFMVALFLIYVLLAIPLKSFLQPLVIMSAIPFGIIGAFIGHIIMGMNLSILSMFGIVGLAGVVVNDALVLVDAINRRIRAGMEAKKAVIEAGKSRFRPILLTSLTTFVGLMPLVLEKSLQARFLVPMAISLAFGVMFATFITLVFVPSLYMILRDLGVKVS